MQKIKFFLTFVLLAVFVLAFTCVVYAGPAYTLKDGSVYLNGQAQECEVGEVALEIEGNIRFWCALENESGAAVYFFSSDGKCETSLPIDSAYSCKDIFFSPDGEKFLLMEGGMGPAMTYTLYEIAKMEKKAEFDGIINNMKWLDPVRFVITRIDDTRENDNFDNSPGPAYGWRVSVVLYDAAAGETVVLKGSTATQNYWLGEVIEDGSAVTVSEEFVKSEKDWGDDEKTETREIKVEIPAAG